MPETIVITRKKPHDSGDHPMPLKLNLGAGRHPEIGWVNVDIRRGQGIGVIADLDQPNCLQLFDTATIDQVRAWGLLEHLQHWENLVMEVARVLKPNAEFEIRVPYKMDYVAHHVRHFDKRTFNPYRSDFKMPDDFMIPRKHVWGSLEFNEPYFTMGDVWVEHRIPLSWHIEKYTGFNLARMPLGRRLNLRFVLVRNDTSWTG